MTTTTLFEDELEIISANRMLLNAEVKGRSVMEWAQENRSEISLYIERSGALLIRGLGIISGTQFSDFLTCIFGEELVDYMYRSTPRTDLRNKVYTATEYPSTETIPQHNENAYSNRWPMKLGFFALLPAKVGGHTPLADSRRIYQRIPKELIEKWREKKIMYVRNYGDLDLPWCEVFQTHDRDVVNEYCQANNIHCEWLPQNKLRTVQINEACQVHPKTKESVWFNQAHLFHVSSLGQGQQDTLISELGEERLPRNAYFGDGTAIELTELEIIRAAIKEETFSFGWRRGDVLILDNMLYTHGRQPFEGPRKILVGMAGESSGKS